MVSTASDCLTDICDAGLMLTSQGHLQAEDEFKVHVTRIVNDLEFVLGELKTVVVDMRKMADQIDLVTSRVDRCYGNCTVDDDQSLHHHGNNVNKEIPGIVESNSRVARTRSRLVSIDRSHFSSPTRTRTASDHDELNVIPSLCGLLQSQRGRRGNNLCCPNSREIAQKSREIAEVSRAAIPHPVEDGEKLVDAAAATISEEPDVRRVEGSLPRSVRTDRSTACVCLCDTSSSSHDTGYCGLYEKELEERLELDATDECLLTPEGRCSWALDWNAASVRNSSDSVRRDEAVMDELLLSNCSAEEDSDDDDDDDDNISGGDDDDDYDDALKCEKTFPSRIMISSMRNCRWRAIIEP